MIFLSCWRIAHTRGRSKTFRATSGDNNYDLRSGSYNSTIDGKLYACFSKLRSRTHEHPQIWKFLFSLQRQRFVISPFIQHLLTQSTLAARQTRELNQTRPVVSRRFKNEKLLLGGEGRVEILLYIPDHCKPYMRAERDSGVKFYVSDAIRTHLS